MPGLGPGIHGNPARSLRRLVDGRDEPGHDEIRRKREGTRKRCTTRRVAQALAAELAAELEEIRCPKYRRGFFGSWRAGYASRRGKIPEIGPPEHKPSDYDLVVVGRPVWGWNACTPVRCRAPPVPDGRSVDLAGRRPAVKAHDRPHGGTCDLPEDWRRFAP
jgi:hypothetical protein